jgi:hypothetical protein
MLSELEGSSNRDYDEKVVKGTSAIMYGGMYPVYLDDICEVYSFEL